jgi:uncharacterized protein (DUF58 family)
VSALLGPTLLACAVFKAHHDAAAFLVRAAAQLIAPLFIVMLAALLVRALEAVGEKRHMLDALDILTAPGRALAWSAALALVGAMQMGWASFAIVGVLGLVVVHLVVTWTALVAAGQEPWRALEVKSSFSPAAPVEGDALVEQLNVTGARIPPGFRLFARGGIDGIESRYAVGGEASGAELSLSAPLGRARRGEHEVAACALWLQDLFGICRTRIVHGGATRLTVLPRPPRVERSPELDRRARGDEAESIAATRLPTEGCFRLREYAPGDDARRIHWPRSLMAQQLIVRQPDEIPPDHPALRLVLDTHLVGTSSLATPAPGELLDALVRVWLGVGRALAQDGTRVTLVAAAPDGERIKPVMRPLVLNAAGEALKLGARVRWQGELLLSALLDVNSVNLIVSARPRPIDEAASWIIVPEFVWTEPEAGLAPMSPAQLSYPAGAPENSWTERRREKRRAELRRRDGLLFDQLLQWSARQLPEGALVARPHGERVLLEAVR